MPATLYERLYNDIYGADAYNRYRLSQVYMTERDREISVPGIDKYINGGISRYQEAVARAKQYYTEADNPSSNENRLQVADMLSQIYPDISFQEAYEQAENFMYYATGYHTDIDNYWEHLNNVFRSTGSGMLAGLRAAVLYVRGTLEGFDSSWQEEKENVFNDINTRYAMNYNADDDRFNDTLLKETGTAIAALAPSMLASMGMTAAGGLLTAVTGGTALPILGSVGIGTGTTLGRISRIASMVSRYSLFGMMDAGSTMIEMANAGFSDDVVLGTGLGMMVASGVLEAGGDPALEYALRPFTSLLNAFGKKEASKLVSDSVKQTIKKYITDIPKATLKNMAAESTTEVLQEFSSMAGYNIALNIEKMRGNVPLSVQGYTAEDFKNAFIETAKQTALGTMGFSLVPGLANFIGSYMGGNIRNQINASRYTSSENANRVINTRNIISPDLSENSNITSESMKNIKTSPIDIIQVGDKYIALNPSDEQIFAIKNSNRVYARTVDMSSEKALGNNLDYDSTEHTSQASIDTINRIIETGIENNALSGFSYLDDNMHRISEYSAARYVSVFPSRSGISPVIIPVNQSADISPDRLEAAVYGETFTKDLHEAKSNNGTSSASTPSSTEAMDAEIAAEQSGYESGQTPSQTSMNEAADILSSSNPGINIDRSNTQNPPQSVQTSQEEQANTAEPKADIQQTVQSPADTQTIQETETRQQAIDRINSDVNRWEEIKRDLTGDYSNDVQILTDYFDEKLKDTDIGRTNKGRRAVASVTAEITAGFARAAGISYEQFYNSISNFTVGIRNTISGQTPVNNIGWTEIIPELGQRYINILRNARPTTLAHEISHHFLSVLDPNSDIYSIIADSYSEQFAEDGNTFGTAVNEAFAKDLEKYIYHRKTANAKLNKLFNSLYNILKAIYNTYKSYYEKELDADKQAMFDIIFDTASTEATDSQLNKVETAAVSDSPIDTAVNDIIPDAAEVSAPVQETRQESTEQTAETASETVQETQNIAEEKPNKKKERKTKNVKKSAENEAVKQASADISEETASQAETVVQNVEDTSEKIAQQTQEEQPQTIEQAIETVIQAGEERPVITETETINEDAKNNPLDDFSLNDYSGMVQSVNTAAKEFQADQLIQSLGRFQRIGAGRYLTDADGIDSINAIMLPEDSSASSAYASYIFTYKKESDIDAETGLGISYIIKLDDGSYRRIRFYTDIPTGAAILVKADSSQQAFGNSVKNKNNKTAAWKAIEKKPSRSKKATDTIELPQTQEEKQQGDKPQKAVKRAESKYNEYNTKPFSMGDIPNYDPDDISSVFKKKINSLRNKISKQIKEITGGNEEEYIKNLNNTVRKSLDEKILSMATSHEVYEALTKALGLDEFNAEDIEIFNGTNGSIIVKLNSDIRIADGKIISVPKSSASRWFDIPLNKSDDSISIYDALSEYDKEDIISNDTVSRVEDDNNRYANEKSRRKKALEELLSKAVDGTLTEQEAREMIPGLNYDIDKENDFEDAIKTITEDIEYISDDVFDEEIEGYELRVKNNFNGYSNPQVYAIGISYAYEMHTMIYNNSKEKGVMLKGPKVLFSSDDSANNMNYAEIYADNFILRLDNSRIYNTYNRFSNFINRIEDNAVNQFNKDFKREYDELYNDGKIAEAEQLKSDEEDRKTKAKQEAVSLALGIDPEAGITAKFAAYLMQDNDFGLSKELSDIKASNYDDYINIITAIANKLINAKRSYSSLASQLRRGLQNKNYLNNAKDLVKNLFVAYSNNVSDKAAKKKELMAWFKGDAKESANKIWNLINSKNNTVSINDDDYRNIINTLTTEDGLVADIHVLEDRYTSPLIELANYYSKADTANNFKNNDSMAFADDSYIDISYSILEENQPDDISFGPAESNQEIITKLFNIFTSNGLPKGSIFNKKSTEDFIDAVILTINNTIASLNRELDNLRISPDQKMELRKMKSEMKSYEDAKNRLEETIQKYKDNEAELNKQLSGLRKENKTINNILDIAGGKDAVKEINTKIKNLENRVKKLTEERSARENELREQINYMENSPEYMTAKELKEAITGIINSTYKSLSTKNADARVGANLSLIFNALRNKDSINMNLFDTESADYGNEYAALRDYMFAAEIIDSTGQIKKQLRDLEFDNLSKLCDYIVNIAELSGSKMRERNAKIAERWKSRERAIIRSIPVLQKVLRQRGYEDKDIDEFVNELRYSLAPGSSSDREPGKLRQLSSQFVQIETTLRSVSPELHALFFGGNLDGEYVQDNLNTAYNSKQRNVIDRKKKLSALFEKVFGDGQDNNKYKAKNFDIMFERVFNLDKRNLSSMTVEDFQKKYGISFGEITKSGKKYNVEINQKLPDYMKPIAFRILKNEANLRTAIDKLDKKYAKDPTLDYEKMKTRIFANYNSILKDGSNEQYTNQQIMGVYLMAGQSDGNGLRRILRAPIGSQRVTNNISIEQVLGVFDLLNSKEYSKFRDFADGLQQIVGERHSAVADVLYRTDNKILPYVNRYFPIVSNTSIEDQIMSLVLEGGIDNSGNIRKNFTKERTGGLYPANLDVVSLGVRAIEAQENYIAFKELSDHYKDMFSENSGVTLSFKKAYGERGRQLVDNINTWTNRIIGAERNDRNVLDRFLTTLRHNMVVSVLWGNISSMLQQFPTFVITARYAGFRKSFEWLFRYIRDPKRMQEFIYNLSPQMEARMRQEIADYRAITESNHFSNSLFDRISSNPIYRKALLPLRERFDAVKRAGLMPMEFLDRSIANSMWLAIYDRYTEQNYDAMKKRGMSEQEIRQAVADMATQTVLSIQTSQQIKDNALAFSDKHQILKQAILFTSQLNKQFNMMFGDVNSVWEQYLVNKSEGKNGKAVLDNLFGSGRLESIIFTGFILGLATAGSAAITGRALPDDDDDDAWDIITNALLATGIESINMIPGGNAFTDVINGVVYYDTGIIGSIKNVIDVSRKNAEDRTPHQLSRAWMNAGNEFFQIFGVPFNTPRKLYNVFTDPEMDANFGELVNSAMGDFVRRVAN